MSIFSPKRSGLRRLRYAALAGTALAIAAPGVFAATITVNDAGDTSGSDCTLRDAITSANTNTATAGCPAGDAGADTINFNGVDTITLGGTQLPPLTDPVTISGPVTIDADNNSRIFTNQTNATLNDLTLINGTTATADDGDDTNGDATDDRSGGAILNDAGGVLTVNGGAMNNNTSDRAGGAIEEASGATASTGDTGSGTDSMDGDIVDGIAGDNIAVTLNNVSFSGNDAGANPGNGGVLHVTGSTDIVVDGGSFDSNSATEGGALWNNAGTTSVTGATFSNNRAIGGAADQGGGAIYTETSGGTLAISDSVFDANNAGETDGDDTDNNTVSSGGAIFVSSSAALTLSDSTLTGNTARRAGGGIEFQDGSTGTLNNVSASGNQARTTGGGGGGNGGVVHVTGSADVDIIGGTYANNTAVEGGALWNNQGEMSLDGVTVVGNEATGDDATQGGGGLYSEAEASDGAGSGTLTITASRIVGNTASGDAGSGGGILVSPGATLNMTSGLISGNSANRAGGGIENANGAVTLTNVTLGGTSSDAGNDAGANPGNGGGLHVGGAGTATLTRSSVGNNTAVEGGGLWNNTTSTMTVDTSTVSNNTADRGAGIYLNGDGSTVQLDFASITNNNGIGIESGTAATGGLVTSMGSNLVANNTTDDIGPNVTVDDDDGFVTGSVSVGDYRLFGGVTATQPLSDASTAALDVNADCGDTDDNTDQRGAERPFDADAMGAGSDSMSADSSGNCDSGAFELTDDPVLTVTANGPASVDLGNDDTQASVLGFTLTNNGSDSVTVGGFSGFIVRDALLPAGVSPSDFDLIVYSDANGNGTFESGETRVGSGSIADNGYLFTVDFDGGAGASIGGNSSANYVVVAQLAGGAATQTALIDNMPLFAGGALLALLGLFSVGGIRRRTQLLLIVAALALTLTACSDGNGNVNVGGQANNNNGGGTDSMGGGNGGNNGNGGNAGNTGQAQFVLVTLDTADNADDTDLVIGDGLPVRGPALTFTADSSDTDSDN